MSMHWITQDWRLKMRILGTMLFPKKQTATNISDRLLTACVDFDVWPKDVESRIPDSEEALRCEILAYLGMKLPLDRSVLTNDCRSDVSTGEKKRQPLGLELLCVSLS